MGGRERSPNASKTAPRVGRSEREQRVPRPPKNDQAHLETKIAKTGASGISTAESRGGSRRQPTGPSVFGSTVVIRDEGRRRAGPGGSSAIARTPPPSEGRLSADSPVARALLGRTRPGERASVVLPKGERRPHRRECRLSSGWARSAATSSLRRVEDAGRRAA